MLEIRAAVSNAPGADFRLETVWLDEPEADEVVVELVAAGLCHTDLKASSGGLPIPFPCVLGHEGAGRVAQVGSAVDDLQVGDPVVLSFGSCGHCTHCAEGHVAYCESFGALNMSGARPGRRPTLRRSDETVVQGNFFGQSSFASHALASRRNVVKVGPDAPLEMLGPLGCGFQTGAGTVLNVLRPGPSSAIGIFGAGGVGLAAVLAAKIRSCRVIVAVDNVAARLDVARELGATHAVDPTVDDLEAALRDIGGLDCAVDTTGAAPVIEAFLPTLRPRGQVALLAAGAGRLSIDIRDLFGGRVLSGVREGDSDPQVFIPELIELMRQGLFPVERLVRFYRFEDINEASRDAKSGAAIKPVLLF